MSDLDAKILEVLRAYPGLKAQDIAAKVGIDRRTVNSALYGRLKGRVRQDSSYRWHLMVASNTERGRSEKPSQVDTPLGRLCRYYLDCLSSDDLGGVSEYATSRDGSTSYAELRTLPMYAEEGDGPFESDAGRQLLNRIRVDRNRQTVFLGYPVRLKMIRSHNGWEGFVVEPILLFPFQDGESRHTTPTLTDDLPQINFKALRTLTNTSETGLMFEAVQLTEELGLGTNTDGQPDLDELLARLRDIRSDWDWQEEIDPHALSSGIPLSDLAQQGIFNRGILVAAERSPYTKGLESELAGLQSIEQEKYTPTALGAWLRRQPIDSPSADQQPLLEVLPLNSEQRQAVRQALSNPLTVITGPPGTGKSQVVTSILINAAWQGKSVLFASKNNKAVDVVETRVNALGPRPILLRLGAKSEYQSRLAEYLMSLRASTATPDDHSRYEECKGIQARIQDRSDAIDAEMQTVVNLRNDVDHLEQEVEKIRQMVGNEVFHKFRVMDSTIVKMAVNSFLAAISQADVAKQSFTIRLVWPFVRKSRFARLAEAANAFRQTAEQIGLPTHEWQPGTDSIAEWVLRSTAVSERFSQILRVREYFAKLVALSRASSLETLSKQRRQLTDELAMNSEALWDTWLRLQPSRLDPEQRRLLGDYGSILQLIVAANDENRQLGRDIFRRYYQLSPKITSILSCWAVTSLSTKDRVPFDPNFFDILVIDEASQCDIASALPLLYRAKRVVVIGDPKQLRHISTLSKQQDQQLLSKHALVDDYLVWAYSKSSLFDLASSLCKSEDIVELRDHHRSHADIIEFSNKTFYEGRLRIATRYDRLRSPHMNGPAVRWVDIRGNATRPGMGGAVNEEEAHAVLKEIDRLITQGYRGTVGVVTPFRAQANRIRDLVSGHDTLSSRIADMEFLVDTVHKFQGDERDVMFFSPVVSSGIGDGSLNFLRKTPNLFNVAITRARAALIVVGDKGAILNGTVDYLAQFAAYVDRVGTVPASNGDCIPTVLGPQYPPVSNPEQVSEWEHTFYRALYKSGFRPIPQYRVEKYALDFAIIANGRRLNIEIDGERYHRNWDGELCRRDQIRNNRLMELGWDVMRFWVYQVRDAMPWCIDRVKRWQSEA